MREIEIKQGHDASSYFWIMPAKVRFGDMITDDDVECQYDSEISIEEGYIECFLEYFFLKYFDRTLTCNKNRHDGCMYLSERFGKAEFEWNLEHNFFTYEQITRMLSEIEWTAHTLETDIENPFLEPIKEGFSIFYMTERNSEDYKAGVTDTASLKRNIAVVTDFYRRFVRHMRDMMSNNPDFDIISVMGP